MAMQITIPGLASDDKVPGFYGETKYGGGRIDLGSAPLRVAFLAQMNTTDGSATPDQDIDRIVGEAEAEALYGSRSHMARMAYAGLTVDGAELWGAPVAAAGGATAATIVATIGGSWTEAGSVGIRYGKKRYLVSVSASDTIQTVANRLRDRLNEDTHGAFGWEAAGTTPWAVTGTCDTVGAHGNQYYFAREIDGMPSGMTLSITGGTAVTGGITPASGGAGDPDVSDVLALLAADEWDYIVSGFNDATNLAAIATHVNAEAVSTIGHLEHFICAMNGTQAAAISMAQTTLNEYRGQLVFSLYNETHPSEIAAWMGAYRSFYERGGSGNPNRNYDDVECPVASPQQYAADRPIHSELRAMLNAGVTPLKTVGTRCYIVRAITTHSLDGTTPDYRTYDVADAVVPDRIRQELGAVYAAWKIANPHLRDNPAAGETPPEEGVGYPDLWQSEAQARMQRWETARWVVDTANNPVTAYYDTSARRIMSAVPCIVMPQNHQLGCSVRQQVYEPLN